MVADSPVTRWRISSKSVDNGSCVEVGERVDGLVAVRNSTDREAGTVVFTRAEMRAFVLGCRAGEFDDLT